MPKRFVTGQTNNTLSPIMNFKAVYQQSPVDDKPKGRAFSAVSIKLCEVNPEETSKVEIVDSDRQNNTGTSKKFM